MRTTFKRIAAVALAIALVICAFPSSDAFAAKAGKKSKNQKNSTIVVKNQKQLDAALEQGYKTIKIKTDKDVTLKIPETEFQGTKLVINAPNAKVINNATFTDGSITAKSVGKLTEKADGNVLVINSDAGKIVIAENATNSEIRVVESKSDKTDKSEKSDTQGLNLNIKGNVEKISVEAESKIDMKVSGTVNEVEVSAKSDINITSSSENTPEIPITLIGEAKDSEIKSEAPVVVEKKETKSDEKDEKKTDPKPAVTPVPSSSSSDSSYTPAPAPTPTPTPTPGPSYDWRTTPITITYTEDTESEFRHFEVTDYAVGNQFILAHIKYSGTRDCEGNLLASFCNGTTGEQISYVYTTHDSDLDSFFKAGKTTAYMIPLPHDYNFNNDNFTFSIEISAKYSWRQYYNDRISVASIEDLVFGRDNGNHKNYCECQFTMSFPTDFNRDFTDFTILFWQDDKLVYEQYLFSEVDSSNPNAIVCTARYYDYNYDGVTPTSATVEICPCVTPVEEFIEIVSGGSISYYKDCQKEISDTNPNITIESKEVLPGQMLLQMRNNTDEYLQVSVIPMFFNEEGQRLAYDPDDYALGNYSVTFLPAHEVRSVLIDTRNRYSNYEHIEYARIILETHMAISPYREIAVDSITVTSKSAIEYDTSSSPVDGKYAYNLSYTVVSTNDERIGVYYVNIRILKDGQTYEYLQLDIDEYPELIDKNVPVTTTNKFWKTPDDPAHPEVISGYDFQIIPVAAAYRIDMDNAYY